MPWIRRAALLGLVASVLTGCDLPAPPPAERTVEDRARGYRIVLPPGWRIFDNEARSANGSLLVVQANSLVGADSKFVAGLPETILPELEAWALYYFAVVEPPERRRLLIGGEPALEVRYGVRVRRTDPPSRVDYWLVRHGDLLYILRGTYPPTRVVPDGDALREALSTWTFVERLES